MYILTDKSHDKYATWFNDDKCAVFIDKHNAELFAEYIGSINNVQIDIIETNVIPMRAIVIDDPSVNLYTLRFVEQPKYADKEYSNEENATTNIDDVTTIEDHEHEHLNLEYPIGSIYQVTYNYHKHYWLSTGIETVNERGKVLYKGLLSNSNPDHHSYSIGNYEFDCTDNFVYLDSDSIKDRILLSSAEMNNAIKFVAYGVLKFKPDTSLDQEIYKLFMYKNPMHEHSLNTKYPIGSIYKTRKDGSIRYWLSVCREYLNPNDGMRVYYGYWDSSLDADIVATIDDLALVKFNLNDDDSIENLNGLELESRVIGRISLPLYKTLEFIYYCLKHEYK